MGPLPASVYRRRRWIAVASTAVVVVVLVWAVVAAFFGSPDENTAVRNAGHAEASAPQQGSPPSAALPSPGAADPAATPTGPQAVPPSPVPFAQVPGLTEIPASSAAAAATSEQLLPDETPGSSAPPPAPVQVPPTGPVPCTDAMLGVAAEVERPEHRVGERPALRLVVTNIGDQPCIRDLDPVRQEVVVWSADGAQRLWSSNDCSRAAGADLRTLVPGGPLVFSVRWAGRTSQPGCAEPRTAVPPGSYRVTTRVDEVVSAPTPFQRLP